MNTLDRENSLLSTFLYANDMGDDLDNTFMLNSDIFTSSYRRAVADKINVETKGDKFYGFLSVTLQDHTKDTKFEQDFIDILAQNPLPLTVAKRIYADLEREYKQRLNKSFR